eukprot:7391555-Prymnesium_polylepis.4
MGLLPRSKHLEVPSRRVLLRLLHRLPCSPPAPTFSEWEQQMPPMNSAASKCVSSKRFSHGLKLGKRPTILATTQGNEQGHLMTARHTAVLALAPAARRQVHPRARDGESRLPIVASHARVHRHPETPALLPTGSRRERDRQLTDTAHPVQVQLLPTLARVLPFSGHQHVK